MFSCCFGFDRLVSKEQFFLGRLNEEVHCMVAVIKALVLSIVKK